jgi:hypothetical protein
MYVLCLLGLNIAPRVVMWSQTAYLPGGEILMFSVLSHLHRCSSLAGKKPL